MEVPGTSRITEITLACVAVAFLLLISLPSGVHARAHAPMLPQVYQTGMDVSGWWMSEKLDGVRAYWDGEVLYSKNGMQLNPPPEFTAGFPPFALEGELWGGRGNFEPTVSCVLRQQPHPGWFELRYAIFDVPKMAGSFKVRLEKVSAWLSLNPSSYVFLIPQTPIEDPAHLARCLDEIVEQGGEGLIVRDPEGGYTPGRSAAILKVKRFEDAEAIVEGHESGNGRNKERLGALLVRTPDGVKFKIGTGFSDAERKNPPPPGTVITYKFSGKYASGIPRFPVYLRVRADSNL
jgi:DNA ligase-1